MAEEPGPMSVKDRIAALKLNQVGRVPGQPPTPSIHAPVSNTKSIDKPRPPPPPRPDLPARPSAPSRTQTTNFPPTFDHGSVANRDIGNEPAPSANGMDGISRPALPPRTSTQSSLNPPLPPRRPSERSPALPPRRPSETPSSSEYQLSRKGSNESISSIATGRSSVSGISATTGTSVGSYKIRAPVFDPSSLPALPPKQTQEQKDKYYNSKPARKQLKSTSSSPNMTKQIGTTPPPAPRRQCPPTVVNQSRVEPVAEEPLQIEPAPPTPSRNVSSIPSQTPIPPPRPTRNIQPPPPMIKRSALDFGMNKSTNLPPTVTAPRPGSEIPSAKPQSNGAPPPIPAGSRPDLTALQASKPKVGGSPGQMPAAFSAGAGACLHCRDFSAPDNHAARFPRQSIPSNDVGWLANQLTAPFPSHTDKARAIFTWLHHNVAYDTEALWNNRVQPSTPHGTITSGLAVCEGYAGLFAALALKAGLEAYVVSGASKGGDYKDTDQYTPYKSSHAWNAVKIDNGVWKLIDPCWGAGNVSRPKGYTKHFKPERFTQSNIDFGRDHFPSEDSKQMREDGRIITYDEYWWCDKGETGRKKFGLSVNEEGYSPDSFKPLGNKISLSQQAGPTVRFSFQKICPHWDPLRNGNNGGPRLFVIKLQAGEASHEKPRVFQTNGDVWWCDVPTRDLGRPGQKVWLWAFQTFGDRDGCGLTVQEFQQKIGKVGYSYSTVIEWEVAP